LPTLIQKNFKNSAVKPFIDFEKAFDSICCSFVYVTLKFFNLGESVIKWVRNFHKDITSVVTQIALGEGGEMHQVKQEIHPESVRYHQRTETIYILFRQLLNPLFPYSSWVRNFHKDITSVVTQIALCQNSLMYKGISDNRIRYIPTPV
jgi:hypothetical protein